ncbi:MAG: tRNA lysidine(34) synthetase TilS [Phycisphaerales bacterium]
MTGDALRPLSRRDPAVAGILRAWRRHTRERTNRRTLIACSAGADSSALALALAADRAVRSQLVIAHIVHDQRAPAEAHADRDAARMLAEAIGVPFVTGAATARGKRGNTESLLRAGRYARLADLAREHGCAFVATAHHRGDQVESVLMALLRGAGPRGVSGIAPRRRLAGSPGVTLIRPMLDIAAEDSRRLCMAGGWTWREDATNADVSRLRARLRRNVMPELLASRAGAGERIAASARAAHAAQRVVSAAACALERHAEPRLDEHGTLVALAWPVGELVSAPTAVAGEALRRAGIRLRTGAGADRLGARQIELALRAARAGRRATIHWSGLDVHVFGSTLEVCRAAPVHGCRAGASHGLPGVYPTRR